MSSDSTVVNGLSLESSSHFSKELWLKSRDLRAGKAGTASMIEIWINFGTYFAVTEIDVFELFTAFQTTEHDHLDVTSLESLQLGHPFERHQVGDRRVRNVKFLDGFVAFESFVTFSNRGDVVVAQVYLDQVWNSNRSDLVYLGVVEKHELQSRPECDLLSFSRLPVQTRERVYRVVTQIEENQVRQC